MKRKLIAVFALVFLFAIHSQAAQMNSTVSEWDDSYGRVEIEIVAPPQVDVLEYFQNESCEDDLMARRGCCSWHGGVCGCDEATDRIICCDGTLSPTCRCSTY